MVVSVALLWQVSGVAILLQPEVVLITVFDPSFIGF
jgi:hypothetical protein